MSNFDSIISGYQILSQIYDSANSAAAIRAKMDEVNELIEEVRSHEAALAETLAALADDFEYPEIESFIQKAKKGTNIK